MWGIRNQAVQGAAREERAEKEREKSYTAKKIQLASVRKKIDLVQSSSQYRYYKLLRELDTQNTVMTQTEAKTTSTEQQLEESKRTLQLLEHQLAQAKEQQRRKNQMVMDYLAQSRTRSYPSPPDSPSAPQKEPSLKESRSKEILPENLSQNINEPTSEEKRVTQRRRFN